MATTKRYHLPERMERLNTQNLRLAVAAVDSLRDKTILEVLSESGLRVAELVSLNVNDVEWELGTVNVRHGKGDKQRHVPFSPAAEASIRQYLQVRSAKEGEEALFVSESPNNRGGRMTTRAVEDITGKRLDINPHFLRHCYARNLVAADIAPSEIMDNMGHSSFNTTKLYIADNPKARVASCRARLWA